MLTVTRAFPRDARFIADHMWDRGRAELAKIGLTNKTDVYVRLRDYCNTPLSFAMYDGSEPIAFFGALKCGDNYFRSWFQATEKFAEHGLRATIKLKRFLDEQAKGYPGATLDLLSGSDHPAAPKWFKLLGFDPAGEIDGFKCYRYVVEFVEFVDATK